MNKKSEVSSAVASFIYDLRQSIRANPSLFSPEVVEDIDIVIDDLSNKGKYLNPDIGKAGIPDELTYLAEGALELERSINELQEEIASTDDPDKKKNLERLLLKERDAYLNLVTKARGQRQGDGPRFEKFLSILSEKRKNLGMR